MRLRILPALMLTGLSLAACATAQSPQASALIVVSRQRPVPWPTPLPLALAAPPKILRVWLSGTVLRAGGEIHGNIVTSTNVASLEVRTASFSINCPKSQQGEFAFRLAILDFPPLLKHVYPLEIIARNTAGQEATQTGVLSIE